MAANVTGTSTSHNTANFAGMLFNAGNTSTPFSSMIGGKTRIANAWKFATSIKYNPMETTANGGLGAAEQPEITEAASLKAPDANVIIRSQNTNFCQIFQKKVSVSYGKSSSMGQLSGINIAGQAANPSSELDFQVGGTMQKIGQDIEYTFINGVGADGAYDDVAYKTSGILSAITSNSNELTTASALTFWKVAELVKSISDKHAPTDGLVLMTNGVHLMQLNVDAVSNKMTIVPNARDINGIRVSTLITPFGDIAIAPANSLIPAGTALVFNPSVCAPVELPVPGKGNMFLEALAKTGAADEYQIYGQMGLDYGAEWYHGKITGLTTTFTAPN
jgi:hypothetical protein